MVAGGTRRAGDEGGTVDSLPRRLLVRVKLCDYTSGLYLQRPVSTIINIYQITLYFFFLLKIGTHRSPTCSLLMGQTWSLKIVRVQDILMNSAKEIRFWKNRKLILLPGNFLMLLSQSKRHLYFCCVSNEGFCVFHRSHLRMTSFR